ncbi:MAG: AraC family transcriptional regulator [Bacteroidales bacterium]|nr:AraC family transcriptional regulator [Bacteroidales bacterium]
MHQKDNIVLNFKHLSSKQLLDTANYHFNKSSFDTALICYNLIINASQKGADVEHQKRVVEAYNRSAIVYQYTGNYSTSFELFIKALLICEEINYWQYISRIYMNIGNIYCRFDQCDIAKSYFLKALDLCQDSAIIVAILNNIGLAEIKNNRIDSVFYFLDEALRISNRHNDVYLHSVLNTIALAYKKSDNYDSAYYYLQLSLVEAKKSNNAENEAYNLSHLAALFFEINNYDSALFYIALSNAIATEHNFLKILAENHLILSKIAEQKRDKINAFEHYKIYTTLKDSIFNVDKFANINQLKRLYEVSKTNKEIEQLAIKQQIKEQTIYLQKIIQFVTLGILLLVSALLFVIFSKNRKLNAAHTILVEKNVDLINSQNNTAANKGDISKKYRKNTLTDETQQMLLDKILTLMEDTSIVCDVEFSVNRLAELVHSNQKYVSLVINNGLKKNFRSFINSYRVREAQRLFLEPDFTKYTIDFVAHKVGFNSRNAFSDAFKEITGVSPTFYVKSVRK